MSAHSVSGLVLLCLVCVSLVPVAGFIFRHKALYDILGRSNAILTQRPSRGPHQLLHGTVKIPHQMPAVISPAARVFPTPPPPGPLKMWVNAFWIQRLMEQSFRR